MSKRFVYIALKYSIDWSGPPPTFAGVGFSVAEALKAARQTPKEIADWLEDKNGESRAYYGVMCYDMDTSPPTKLDLPDLKRGGGPYLGERE